MASEPPMTLERTSGGPAPAGFGALHAAINAAQREAEELLAAGDLEAAAWQWLRILAPARQMLNDLYREVEVALFECGPWSGGTWQPEGLPILQARQGTDRKRWRCDEVLNDAIPRLLAKHEGSYLDAIGELLSEIVPITPSGGFKAKGLRAIGMDPDEYAETSPGRVSVQVHGEAS